MRSPFIAAMFLPITAGLFGQSPRSDSREVALGQSMFERIQASSTILPSGPIRDYINQLGGRLSGQLPAQDQHFIFEVASGGEPGAGLEASGLPGGRIVVPARVILAARTESQLGGMLALAMARLSEQRGQRIFVTGDSSLLPLGARGMLMQADREALRVLNSAGYDAASWLAYLEDPVRTSPDRLAALRAELSRLPERQSTESAAFHRVQDAVRRLP